MNGPALLGVNVDHAATVRQARREGVPDLVAFALAALEAGADGITIHLREDRRHIQDEDFERLAPVVRLNLEMAVTEEMVAIACGSRRGLKPRSVCLVPERRQEVTTEGGLDVVKHRLAITGAVERLHAADVIVSAFVEPDPWQIEASARAGADFVELHTGAYARAFAAGEGGAAALEDETRRLVLGARAAAQLGLGVNAGHGLTAGNVGPVARLPEVEELNIGFSLVARALFAGIGTAIREMKTAIAAAGRG